MPCPTEVEHATATRRDYVTGFGRFDRNNNGSGRLIQFALKIYW